jgi:hypothetical protein
MSVYSELIRMALADDEHEVPPLPDLVARAVALRFDLIGAGDPAARIAASVAYDVALTRVCERVRVRHDLTGELAGPEARHKAELHLLELMPSLGGVLSLDEPR